MDQKINDSKPHFWSFSLNSRFSSRKSHGQKISKKDHSVCNTVSLKKTHSFYEPQLTEHYIKYISATQPKTFLYQFFSKYTSGCCKKKDLRCYIYRRPKRNSASIYKANVCTILNISVRKFYLVRGRIISLRQLSV